MIYCTEDDKGIRELIVYTLSNTGFEAQGFECGTDLFAAMNNRLPKLILLDIMLPGTDGISILKKIRSDPKTKKIPVIMITAKGTEYDKIIGLDSGADDYITKPFGMMELVSRIKAVLRRADIADNDDEYTVGGLNINIKGHTVTCEGRPVSLTLKEFELLRYLIQNEDIVLTRDMLLINIWGYDFTGETRTVDVHIRTLRQKLGPCGNMIGTVRGVGYIIGSKK
ncbi:MAG: winged helix-turn-helix domain-containing protein [Clostridia bacterium]